MLLYLDIIGSVGCWRILKCLKLIRYLLIECEYVWLMNWKFIGLKLFFLKFLMRYFVEIYLIVLGLKYVEYLLRLICVLKLLMYILYFNFLLVDVILCWFRYIFNVIDNFFFLLFVLGIKFKFKCFFVFLMSSVILLLLCFLLFLCFMISGIFNMVRGFMKFNFFILFVSFEIILYINILWRVVFKFRRLVWYEFFWGFWWDGIL